MPQTTLNGFNDKYEKMEVNTIKTLETTMGRVKYVLGIFPSSRGDDRILFYYYMRIFGGEVKLNIKQFRALLTMPSPETVRRARQKIQQKGEFLPSERVIRKRARREEIIRKNIARC